MKVDVVIPKMFFFIKNISKWIFHMYLDKILVQLEMPVVLTLIVPIVVDVHSVNADVAM